MIPQCPRCQKSQKMCVCASIKPLSTQLHILILQHPQEPKEPLSSAHITHLALPNSTLKIGLSWANLRSALGREAVPSQWAVLYLGSGIKSPQISTKPAAKPTTSPAATKNTLQFVSKNGAPADRPSTLEGIIILDGTWTQAKALWWRNAWLLKLKRIILQPNQPSLYGSLRKEPRKECLSTLESAAEALVGWGEPSETGESLRALFSELLGKYKKPEAKSST